MNLKIPFNFFNLKGVDKKKHFQNIDFKIYFLNIK